MYSITISQSFKSVFAQPTSRSIAVLPTQMIIAIHTHTEQNPHDQDITMRPTHQSPQTKKPDFSLARHHRQDFMLHRVAVSEEHDPSIDHTWALTRMAEVAVGSPLKQPRSAQSQ